MTKISDFHVDPKMLNARNKTRRASSQQVNIRPYCVVQVLFSGVNEIKQTNPLIRNWAQFGNHSSFTENLGNNGITIE